MFLLHTFNARQMFLWWHRSGSWAWWTRPQGAPQKWGWRGDSRGRAVLCELGWWLCWGWQPDTGRSNECAGKFRGQCFPPPYSPVMEDDGFAPDVCMWAKSEGFCFCRRSDHRPSRGFSSMRDETRRWREVAPRESGICGWVGGWVVRVGNGGWVLRGGAGRGWVGQGRFGPGQAGRRTVGQDVARWGGGWWAFRARVGWDGKGAAPCTWVQGGRACADRDRVGRLGIAPGRERSGGWVV